jgi:hypothetical protein
LAADRIGVVTQKLFVLGVGAQRAGTTWLHHQLSGCNGVDMGFTKEYHALINPKASLRGQWRRHRRQQQQLRASFGSPRRFCQEEFLALTTEQKQLLMRVRRHHYVDYFDHLVADNPTIHATGDISPSYAQLHGGSLRDIRIRLRRRGFTVKLIFLIRDPVDRIQSQLRLIRREGHVPELSRIADPDQALAVHYRSARCERHSRYEHTLAAIEAAFPANEVLVEFHERLFQPDSHARLARFLKLDLPPPELTKKVNAAPGPRCRDTNLLKAIAHHYAPTYAACRERFGDQVEQLWPYAHLV